MPVLEHLPLRQLTVGGRSIFGEYGAQELHRIDRGIARFVLTGSSARKLRCNSSANLLPGRVSDDEMSQVVEGLNEIIGEPCVGLRSDAG